jgi:hypothetical protein
MGGADYGYEEAEPEAEEMYAWSVGALWYSSGVLKHKADCARRRSPGVITEIPHLMAGSVYRLAGAGRGSAEGVCGGVMVA